MGGVRAPGQEAHSGLEFIECDKVQFCRNSGGWPSCLLGVLGILFSREEANSFSREYPFSPEGDSQPCEEGSLKDSFRIVCFPGVASMGDFHSLSGV